MNRPGSRRRGGARARRAGGGWRRGWVRIRSIRCGWVMNQTTRIASPHRLGLHHRRLLAGASRAPDAAGASVAGNSQASAFTCATTRGGKSRRSHILFLWELATAVRYSDFARLWRALSPDRFRYAAKSNSSVRRVRLIAAPRANRSREQLIRRVFAKQPTASQMFADLVAPASGGLIAKRELEHMRPAQYLTEVHGCECVDFIVRSQGEQATDSREIDLTGSPGRVRSPTLGMPAGLRPSRSPACRPR